MFSCLLNTKTKSPKKGAQIRKLFKNSFFGSGQSCHLRPGWRTMSPSSRSVHYLARRACAHDLCRISRSTTCGQRFHWPMHIKSFQKTRATLHLTAFANSAKAHLQLAEMQPGRDTCAFLERIRCAAATRKAVGGRRFQRSCTDRHHTLAIPWDASRAPFLLLASILQISPECFFPRSLQEGFLNMMKAI